MDGLVLNILDVYSTVYNQLWNSLFSTHKNVTKAAVNKLHAFVSTFLCSLSNRSHCFHNLLKIL